MKKTLLIATIFLTIGVAGLHAQAKWKYEFGLGGTYNSGNISNVGFRTNGGVGVNDSVKAVFANIRFLYNEEKKVTTNMGLDGGIKFDYYRNIHWNPFLAAEFIVNHFKGYDFKSSFLLGMKYNFVYTPTYDYSISAALVGDYVDYYYEVPPVPKDTLSGVKMRVSVRGQIRHKIGESTTLYHATFYQPAVTDFSDFIFSSVTKISNKLRDNISLDFIFDYGYRSVVPEDKHRHDLATEVALKITF
ncbi:MAG: DUF481 domain-containing protein [Bacteroidales bacterium]|nr:DUF481 domain-containing protein [Bacteroidales bacterium]